MRFVLALLVLLLAAVQLPGQSLAPTAPVPAPGDQPVRMDRVEVTAIQQTFLNSIDRKTYNVGADIQSVTGSASDILQNIPSVQVDIDGNVSLRGDDNVQILIDGRSSALMGANRADVLAALPADSIERIEVITNPSAMYKPDGSAGIINIVLKKKHKPGISGSLRLTAGNGRRFGATLNGSYNPGRYNIFGTLTLRQDDRIRVATDNRSFTDPTTLLPATTQTTTTEHGRPLSEIAQIGFEYNAAKTDKLGETINYNCRTFVRHAAEHDVSGEGAGPPTTNYDRLRVDPEYERDLESKTTYEHDFNGGGHTLNLEFRGEHHTEEEDNQYSDVYAVPVTPTTHDHTRIFTNEPGTEATAEYSDPLSANSKLELGFNRTEDISNQDHFREVLDPTTSNWEVDPSVTNRFILDQTVQALYGTYRQSIGDLGVMPGLRLEQADVGTNQVTSGILNETRYHRLYPSLHLTYDLTETRQLQLNYSHRVRRPESDDLNPYPEYQDPYNLREGNPYLKAEETHSLETGYQYKKDETAYLAALFYRYSYDDFTTVSQYISPTTLLTTEENLSESQSGGAEWAATVLPGENLSLNASGNIFYNQIDASNLGYGTKKSTFAWAGKLSADYDWSKSTTLQLNANYTAKRLTPQGYRLPTFVTNFGIKHELKNRSISLILTVSDLLNSLKEETRLSTPVLTEDSTRRRSSRIVYVGVTYGFGSSKKKAKEDTLQFDNNL